LCDGRTYHNGEIMFWEQRQNQLHKIPKIPRLSQHGHYRRSLNFSMFSFEFRFQL
jgi:hypothetical protein